MYLLDSNILIYYLNGDKNVISFVENIEDKPFISVVSVTELLAKPSLSQSELAFIDAFLQKFSVLDIDFYGAREAAYLKRSYRLTFPDALIAATAKVFHLTLISRDKIFKKIPEIKAFYP